MKSLNGGLAAVSVAEEQPAVVSITDRAIVTVDLPSKGCSRYTRGAQKRPTAHHRDSCAGFLCSLRGHGLVVKAFIATLRCHAVEDCLPGPILACTLPCCNMEYRSYSSRPLPSSSTILHSCDRRRPWLVDINFSTNNHRDTTG